MVDLDALAQAIICGKKDVAESLTKEAIAEGIPAAEILNNGLVAGMSVVGQKFKVNEFYVPEVLIAARAMHAAMAQLRPILAESGAQPVAKVAIGTVKGDLHDIGKNLVAMMMEGAGFEVTDLGVNVDSKQFIDAIQNQGVQIVALSALLTTTMPAMRDTVEAIKTAGLRGQVQVMVGGAPVTQNYADEIGADGYSPDAASAVEKAKELLNVA